MQHLTILWRPFSEGEKVNLFALGSDFEVVTRVGVYSRLYLGKLSRFARTWRVLN